MKNPEPLWATGPGEILRHGLSLLGEDTDTNRRLAMICIDNSVELMMKTYIGLPKRITQLNITRKERDEIGSTFPALLDGIEKYAEGKLIGLNLGEIEWFHRLRNELYHQGNGLTVERTKVEVYAELAVQLFKNLFGVDIEIESTKNMRKLGEFMDSWIKIEKILSENNKTGHFVPPRKIMKKLNDEGSITDDEYLQFLEVNDTRNALVHGQVEPTNVLTKRTIDMVKSITKTILQSYGI